MLDLSSSPGSAPIVNVQQTGYYRVNYDLDIWSKIKDAKRSDVDSIPRANRAQTVDDALNLAKVGMLPYFQALDQLEYLDLEEEFIPWQSTSRGLSYLSLMMSRQPDYALLKDFILEKVTHVYQRLGLDPLPGDSYFDSQLRVIAANYMCSYRNSDCLDQANEEFNIWFTSPNPDDENSNPIDAGVRRIVYCTSVSSGSNEVWDFMFERYSNSNNANERSTILSALGCSGDAATLQR